MKNIILAITLFLIPSCIAEEKIIGKTIEEFKKNAKLDDSRLVVCSSTSRYVEEMHILEKLLLHDMVLKAKSKSANEIDLKNAKAAHKSFVGKNKERLKLLRSLPLKGLPLNERNDLYYCETEHGSSYYVVTDGKKIIAMVEIE